MVTYRTALVTGASSGIGEAIARELAARGSDLVLVARRTDRMQRLAGELSGRYGVRAGWITADLATEAGLATVEPELAEVDLLVHSAGAVTGGRYAELPVTGEEAELRLNVLAVLRLTGVALPGMVARRHGGVLAVSSVAGFQPLPGHATYAASKAFLTSFCESLAGELRGTGVHITALCPGFVRTDFVGEPPAALVLDPRAVARAGLAGVERGRPLVVPSLRWKALGGLGRHLPRPVLRAASRRLGAPG